MRCENRQTLELALPQSPVQLLSRIEPEHRALPFGNEYSGLDHAADAVIDLQQQYRGNVPA